MIGKVMTGKSFGGCVQYVVGKPEAKILDACGVRTDCAERISRDFDLQRKMNPELSQAVGHIALSWSIHDKDKLNESVMVRVAQSYLEKMKITDTQYLIALHQDRQHPHVHIIYNRVNNQGKTISDRFQRQLNGKVCKELTLRHGFHLAEGKQSVNRHRLRGADKEKYQLFDAISKAVGQSSTWAGLEEKLKWQGISVQYKYRSGTMEVQGVSFGKSSRSGEGTKGDRGSEGSGAAIKAGKNVEGEISFKGSELDRSLSYGNISKELARNRQALGLEQLAAPGQAESRYQHSEDFAVQSSTPNYSPGNKTADQELDNSEIATQGSHFNHSNTPATQETESVGLKAAETAVVLATSLLSGLSFSSGDQDDEQHKKKKKQSYKR
ncbi:MAG: relaxase/mobilization nuclease domain-containing protein [Janthinobacterium lividum]